MVLQADTDPEVTRALIQSARSRYARHAMRRIPLAAWVAAQHALGLSEQSRHVDLWTRLVVGVGQSFFSGSDGPTSIAELQAMTLRPRAVPDQTWISRYASPPPPESGAADAVMRAVRGMVRLEPGVVVREPGYVTVEAEWTAYAEGARPLREVPERDKYARMMADVRDPTTILYLHGGGYLMLDPKSHRPFVKELCKRTGGRAYSVRYRLSPQAVFPAALLDAFVSYLTLLYPPPGAFHEPVKPEHIVLAGDSAGGNLTLSLLQLLLELGRQDVRVAWHGAERVVPLPAGAACNSPWLDVTHSLIPYGGDRPLKYDVTSLPVPETGWMPRVRADHIWPATPPRRNFYADDHLVSHPLVSVLGTRAADWAGAPPVYVCTGWEHLGTEARVFARRLATRAGVKVVLDEYEAMPHCFALIMPTTATARHCWDGWAGFVSACVRGPEGIRSRARRIRPKTLVEEEVDFEKVVDLSDDEARAIFDSQNSPFKVAPRL
ncbi:Alpha/beta hydrolase fold-3 [Cordyceps fumosorosea ARSEF 2679]|uniref:Alpha/beta hydrolase fold-3 n=1 Tax=Cordyceps fumosorosea (strain ARSEF 2679) TaxID=1081104 RepID=A0A167VU67_CORFA|nr:Alpha/beta hydrolase fold-3 [Cordyceps fumosorosea ARSEF 2679]OAA62983.1 Alpha/beta hydrolase fold-3 [Cordyceps fumosorosea ARSEF 2679]